jgi:hypothetical protein
VPASIQTGPDLLAALYHSEMIDTASLGSPLSVAVKGVQARPHKSKEGAYIIRLFVGDQDNDFYHDDGYTLYGENLAFLKMRDPSTPMPDLIDEQKKRHRIPICELTTSDDSRAKRLAKSIRELLGPKIIVGALGYIPTPAEHFKLPDL